MTVPIGIQASNMNAPAAGITIIYSDLKFNDSNSIAWQNLNTQSAGAQVGDMALAIICNEASGANVSITKPSNWTQVVAPTAGGSSSCYARFGVYKYQLQAGDIQTNYDTGSWDNMINNVGACSGTILILRGANYSALSSSNVTVTNPTLYTGIPNTSVTEPGESGDLGVSMAIAYSTSLTAPAGMTQVEPSVLDGVGISTGAATMTNMTTSNKTWTINGPQDTQHYGGVCNVGVSQA